MAETQVLEPPPKKNKGGRPPKSTADTAPAGSASFWETATRIPDKEWGERAVVYAYRLEPKIDKGGSKHYIQIYREPISEDRILMDHGSGKYQLLLNYKKPGEATGSSIDSTVISLSNIKFPPKIQPGEWIDHPDNKQWEWVKATFPKPAGESGTLLEAVRVVGEIQAGAQAKEPAPNRVMETVETIRAVKDLMPPPAAPQTENKTLESIVTLMIANQNRAQQQNDNLLTLLIQQIGKAQTQPSEKTSIKEVIALVKDEIIPLVEKLKPGEVLDGFTRRSKMTGWQEMIQPAIPVVVDFLKPFAAGLAQNLFSRMAQPNGVVNPGAPTVAAPSPALASGAPATNGAMPPLLNMIAPVMVNFMRIEADPETLGEDFASWVHDGYAVDSRYTNAINMARASGPGMIIAQFKGSAWWTDTGPNHDQPSLQQMEGKFGRFVNAFLNWKQITTEEPTVEGDMLDNEPQVIDI